MRLENLMYRIVGHEGTHFDISMIADNEIYKAHFPGNPITPGVCIVQIITELLEQVTDLSLTLDTIVNLKFSDTISPVDDPDVSVDFRSIDDLGEQVKARGSISSGEELKTKFSIIWTKV